jgi:hypothetical protein
MTGRGRKFLKLALGVAIALVTITLVWKVFETSFYRRALPSELETKGFATTQSDMNLLVALLPLRHEACGGAIFRMTDQVRAAITTKGLAFFANAQHGRGYPPGHPSHHYYTYQPWQETPAPPAWTSEGIWIGLHCMKLDRETVGAIRAAALRPGSYYSTKSEAELLVIPSLGLIVFTYYG